MNKRDFFAGAVAFGALACGKALAQSATPIRLPASRWTFAGTPTLQNLVARFFFVPKIEVPNTDLISTAGIQHLLDLTGKVRLVCLWSETTAMCLQQLRDLAPLQARYGGDQFEIIALLTGSKAALDLPAAYDRLKSIKADNLKLWIEPNGGDVVARSLTVLAPGGGPLMPCVLLVDAQGRFRGRDPAYQDDPTHSRSIWATPDADDFIKRLLNGALTSAPT